MKTYLVRIRERSSIKNLLRERSELKKCHKKWKQAGAELCQAQVKL